MNWKQLALTSIIALGIALIGVLLLTALVYFSDYIVITGFGVVLLVCFGGVVYSLWNASADIARTMRR